jgi:exopolyphosphatase/guanosine-5'-triphosphate,3'-diphosphate pyrophosphatase
LSRRYAVVSIGTNSTRLLLADLAPQSPHVEMAQSIGTRLGEGLGPSGRLDGEPVRRTLEAIRQFQRMARGHYLRIFAIATSALRRAENADAFAHEVQELLGVPLRVLTGEEEAAASYRGALTAFGALHGERIGVVDAGGGSTEYAVGSGDSPERFGSYEIGAVRLTEAVPQLAGRDGVVDLATIERARALARQALAVMREYPPVERVALVGGTATTAAAIVRARKGRIASFALTRTDLQRVLVRLCAASLKERKTIAGMKPQRADILPAGIIVLDTALDIIKRETAIATTADLLLGFLLLQRDADPSMAGQRQPFGAGSGAARGPGHE